MQEPTVYILHPTRGLAFRDETKTDDVYCKCHGGKEVKIPFNDEDYMDAWQFCVVLTKEEYDKY